MENLKKNVIVCGTTFGQYYLKAIKKREDLFVLKGILASGSDRSKAIAKEYGVTLYTAVDQLPDDIDFACVVIRADGCGGIGTTLAIDIMNRGISVIAEQPIHKSHLKDTLKVAVAKKVCYETGNLYMHLDSTKCFVDMAHKLNNSMPPLYIRASFSTQVSFPALELLNEIVTIREGIQVETINNDNYPFSIVTGKLKGIPITIEFQNQICPSDPDGSMHLLHEITVFYPSGRLVLSDTMGSVVYRPRIYIPKDKYDADHTGMDQYTELVLYKKDKNTFLEEVENSWINAITENLIIFTKRMDALHRSGKQDNRGAKELLVAAGWEQLHEIFGFSRLVDDSDYVNVNIDEL